MSAAEDALAREIADLKRWKDAVLDALVVNHLLMKEHRDNPILALADLIDWEQAIALDPAVSSEARALRDTYKADAERYRLTTQGATHKINE